MIRGMEATRIIAIRHGETPWNRESRIQGHLDIPLNDRGRTQAERLARALADRDDIHAIYSSDLLRASATAQMTADAIGAPVYLTPALRERCFGDYEGSTFAHVTQAWPEQAEKWRKRDPHWSPPGGGESLTSLQQRLKQTVDELASRHVGQQIALFTHGGVLDVLYRLATGLGLQDARTWELGNAAVNRLLWTPGGLSLVGWGDQSHLDGIALDESTA